MKKNLPWYIAGILLLGVIILLLLWPSPPENVEVKAARDSILILQAQERAAIKAQTTIRIELNNAKQKASVAQARFVGEIKVLKKQLREKRVVVQQVIDSIPDLRDFVATQDTVILRDSIRIQQLLMEKQVMEKGFNLLIAQKTNECDALRGMNSNLEYINDMQKRDLRKARRGARWLKVGAVVGVAGALVLGASL